MAVFLIDISTVAWKGLMLTVFLSQFWLVNCEYSIKISEKHIKILR